MTKLLCAADLHLGRQPSRLPQHLTDRARDLGPASAWERLVEVAVDERVDAVLLAGDVVEDDRDFFEAYADLHAGALELTRAGIELVAVAGNHDVTVLPRLARAVDGVTLLGADGKWESMTVGQGSAAVNVVGWSWPDRHVPASPLAGLAEALAGLEPRRTLGLLHCDLDSAGSRYAPVGRADLEAAPIDVWLLGHVHKPGFALANGRHLGYLGSLSAADPGEEGHRGGWHLTIGRAGVEARDVHLSPLRFDTLTLDVTDLGSADELGDLLLGAVADHARALVGVAPAPPLAVGLRIRVVGRTDLCSELERRLRTEDPRDAPLPQAGIEYFVHDVVFEAMPPVDVGALAAAGGLQGLMARRMLAIAGPDGEERCELLARAREAVGAAAASKTYEALDAPDLGDEALLELLEEAAARLLSEMTA